MTKTDALKPAATLKAELPLSSKAAATANAGRDAVAATLTNADDRLVVIVGPCSIHDVAAATDYAQRLAALKPKLDDALVLVMRVYFEKPRTTVGWKGLINDPDLNSTYNVNKGLHTARSLLLQVNELGLPAATEFLDTITPAYVSDLISWGAIGARTSESQIHREMVSGLAMPVGYKNGTSGDVQVAVDACGSSIRPHAYLGVTDDGTAAILHSDGNPHCHLILRGGANGPNYESQYVAEAGEKMAKGGLAKNIVIDCSHGNSKKKFENQPLVAEDIAAQITAGGPGASIKGVMIESHIVEGAQKIGNGTGLTYGQSITDACIGWSTTEAVLDALASAVRKRRAGK